ncbi:MAG: hypothetical protein U0T74_06110 [Chitinophagales bacterium]
MTLSSAIGFSGVFVLLIAFLLNLLKVLSFESRIYLFMNLVGASLACAASIMIHYTPFIILEGVWSLVSLLSLIRVFISKT